MVLVQKKDGKLRFNIDLRRLNAWTVKDAYRLSQIDKTLDYLNCLVHILRFKIGVLADGGGRGL